MSWITIVGFFALLGIKLGWDWYNKNKLHRIINHGRSAFYDVCIYVALVYFPNDYTSMEDIFIATATLIIARGVFFDPLFNLLNGDSWFHVGNSSLIDRVTDKMDGKEDDQAVAYAIAEVVALLGCIFYLWRYV